VGSSASGLKFPQFAAPRTDGPTRTRPLDDPGGQGVCVDQIPSVSWRLKRCEVPDRLLQPADFTPQIFGGVFGVLRMRWNFTNCDSVLAVVRIFIPKEVAQDNPTPSRGHSPQHHSSSEARQEVCRRLHDPRHQERRTIHLETLYLPVVPKGRRSPRWGTGSTFREIRIGIILVD
jgi:hypothetical protein